MMKKTADFLNRFLKKKEIVIMLFFLFSCFSLFDYSVDTLTHLSLLLAHDEELALAYVYDIVICWMHIIVITYFLFSFLPFFFFFFFFLVFFCFFALLQKQAKQSQ